MKHIDRAGIAAALDYSSLIEALRAAHARDKMPEVDIKVLTERGIAANNFISLIAWQGGEFIAVKLVGVFPSNLDLKPPQPSVQGLVVLFDGKTGAPVLTADGAEITFRKTAADSALAADYLAKRDARTLLVVGAGGLAPHVIRAHRSVRPSIERVLIWNRNFEKAEALARDLSSDTYEVNAIRDLDAMLPSADIVSCVTMATEPLVKGALLSPGCHVDLIGAYLPTMREADDDVARRAGRIFVDTRVGCEGSGEVAELLSRGIITTGAIVADLFDLCTSRHSGREAQDQITMFKNVGGPHLDGFTVNELFVNL
jgi:ornithine cyclodeaminase